MLEALLQLVIGLLVLGLVWWIVRYAAGAFGLPAIVVKIATLIIVVIAVLWLIQVLMSGGGQLGLPEVN